MGYYQYGDVMQTIKKTLALYKSEFGEFSICGNFPTMEEFRLTEFVEIEFQILDEKTELHDPSRIVGI